MKHNREKVHKAMEEKGIQLSGYIYELPLHKQPIFEDKNQLVLSETESLCSRHVCLPIYPLLKSQEAKYVGETFKNIVN